MKYVLEQDFYLLLPSHFLKMLNWKYREDACLQKKKAKPKNGEVASNHTDDIPTRHNRNHIVISYLFSFRVLLFTRMSNELSYCHDQTGKLGKNLV